MEIEQQMQNLVADNNRLKDENEKSKIYAKLLDGIPSPVFAIDNNFTVTFMNKTGAKLVGETVLSVAGKKCYDLFKSGDCQTEKCACSIAMKHKKVAISTTVAHPKNLEVPIQYVGKPLYDENKNVVGAIETVTDITQIQGIIQKATESSKSVMTIADGVHAQSKKMEELGKQTAHVATELSNGMMQVSIASQKVSAGAQKLAELAQATTKQTEYLKRIMDAAGESVKQTSKIAEEAVKKATDANLKGQQGIVAINSIRDDITKVAEAVGSMVNSIDKVGTLANAVSDIAGQTNMLALNAAIEAARAGEAGRGFAVVADAVKGLAGQSKEAAGSSINLVKGIKEAGAQTSSISMQSKKGAEESSIVVQGAIKETEGISKIMDETNGEIQKLSTNVQDGVKALNEVVSAIEGVLSIAEESSSASEETSSTIEEQTAAAQKLSEIAKNVQGTATEVAREAEKTKKEAEMLIQQLTAGT